MTVSNENYIVDIDRSAVGHGTAKVGEQFAIPFSFAGEEELFVWTIDNLGVYTRRYSGTDYLIRYSGRVLYGATTIVCNFNGGDIDEDGDVDNADSVSLGYALKDDTFTLTDTEGTSQVFTFSVTTSTGSTIGNFDPSIPAAGDGEFMAKNIVDSINSISALKITATPAVPVYSGLTITIILPTLPARLYRKSHCRHAPPCHHLYPLKCSSAKFA